MKKISLLILSIIACSQIAFSQFAPPAGQEGSTAIAADSSLIKSWTNQVEIIRGYQNIADTAAGFASYGSPNDATGAADNKVVSLGDGGIAIYTLDEPINNVSGHDFAVFENSFSDEFLELAFVEVSSDGETYVRFPAISNTPTETQVGGFGVVDATKIHNLAGKYRALFGTPFDLSDLKDSTNVDINHITHIKIIDAIGTINPEYATYDSNGNIVNDPYPTPFYSSGYDLDALAILNPSSIDNIEEVTTINVSIKPNPVSDYLLMDSPTAFYYQLYSSNGLLVSESRIQKKNYRINLQDYTSGIYFLKIVSQNHVRTEVIVKQ